MISHFEMIVRIAMGSVLGGIIGFERDIHGRQAGLRTHLIVAMASATFMVVSNHFLYFQNYDFNHHVEADVSRIAASVVSGIGFLAGGAILKTGATIQGLTTAAGLWLVAAIGLAAGAGMYVVGGAVTLMGLIALTVFRLFEDKNDKLIRRRVTLTIDDDLEQIPKIMKTLKEHGVIVHDFDYVKTFESNLVEIAFDAKIPREIGVDGIIKLLEMSIGVQQLHIRV